MKQFKVGLREVTSKIGAELGYPDWWFDCEELAQDRIGNISIPAIDVDTPPSKARGSVNTARTCSKGK